MSHGKTREEKNCLNCGHTVEERFCPHCGQENTEPRQPFYFLFTHFIEDFTHYDGQFWKTIKYLLFYPGKLTKEYLSGKRQLYVAPVKLYIFISFLTFFIPTLFPQSENPDEENAEKHSVQKEKENKKIQAAQISDSIKNQIIRESGADSTIVKSISKLDKIEEVLSKKEIIDTDRDQFAILGATNMKQYDSMSVKGGKNYNTLRPFAKKIFHLQDRGLKRKEIVGRFVDTFIHTFPKALFVYLPIFAFFLWLFHSKKKWWYFDHGIFTLHYFSFILLSSLIFILFGHLVKMIPDYKIFQTIFRLFYVVLFFYTSAYFFIAHHRVYESSKRKSILKGSILFIINCIGLLFMLMILSYISFIMMH
ncbi:DUF3667 domain-containing protein [Chryseobacterium paridis]|uniref:DUF3667 domain-containing protein n=1 Tax=Chryseobacterium paridis TaxID=2800328 RepID=A0ABS1G0K2_9FLAO|nr:DUF3667 domain-containing protein [Chryseobacterium paridis]MBK1898225.1 DUF3667 domain-containing protein [Chryseobacterium paridis]